MSGGLAECTMCHDVIRASAPNYERVTGWAKLRRDGGTNAVTMPRRHHEYACRACIDAAKTQTADTGELW